MISNKKITIIIPLFNEEAVVEQFYCHLSFALNKIPNITWEILFVDDGSTDQTLSILQRLSVKDKRLQILSFMKNEGHQKALIAGIDHADGDAVIMMDGDGQHPVEIAIEMVRVWLKNPDIHIIQGIRRGNQGGKIKNIFSSLFYSFSEMLIKDSFIVKGSADFRLMSREAVDIIKLFRDRHRNLRLLISSLKLPTINIKYKVGLRLAGESKYSFLKMLALAKNGLFAFTKLPLKICLFLSVMTFCFGIGALFYSLLMNILGSVVPGWTSIIGLISLFFSANFLLFAIFFEYIALIYEEVRDSPLFIIRSNPKIENIDEDIITTDVEYDNREKKP